jgi:hypothetical protein
VIRASLHIKAWKLPYFERHLKKAGYAWEQHPGITPTALVLKVRALSALELQAVAEAADKEAMRGR